MILRCVFPVYNESRLIEDVVKQWVEVTANIDSVEVQLYFYNDGSKDNTLSILEELSDNYSAVHVLNKLNSGHGSTLIRAYQDALNDNVDWVFQADSDGDMEPMKLSELWAYKDNFAFLIGFRNHRKQNFIRFGITRISRLLIILFFGLGIKDVNAPFRLIRKDILQDFISLIEPNTFAPNLLMSAYINKKHIPFLQIPVNHKELKTQSLKQSFNFLSKAFQCVIDLIKFIRKVK